MKTCIVPNLRVIDAPRRLLQNINNLENSYKIKNLENLKLYKTKVR